MSSKERLTKPDFLIIGAARSGTSSLYNILSGHPDIYMAKPPRPEPHYYLKSAEYEKGTGYYMSKWFGGWSGEKIAGEKSASYLFDARVPRRIVEHCPNVKLIAILRNPLERAYSNYRISVANGFESCDFFEALEKEASRSGSHGDPDFDEVQPYAYLGRSRYATQLRRYLEIFDNSQLLVLLLDDLAENGHRCARQMFHFLGVDEAFQSDNVGVRFNALHSENACLPVVSRWVVDDLLRETQELEDLLKRDLGKWKRELSEVETR